ncbi:hypothetical protein NOCARDAX2BIS_460046 [Nocardioides sp. AX2bis]|nr:hypothetical protein NOCARDAX2BIS_460046 [Nocardioides sp. AX2bis]
MTVERGVRALHLRRKHLQGQAPT